MFCKVTESSVSRMNWDKLSQIVKLALQALESSLHGLGYGVHYIKLHPV